jgi:hypothetical protein
MNLFENLGEILRPENPLKNLEQTAQRAYNNISFSPERRGTQIVNDYGEELNGDIEELKKADISEETISEYVERYKRFFSSYLGAKSRTFSVMITGAGNFPVRRHEKANRSEQRHYEIFREWRQRAKKAIVRKAAPIKTYLSELERYKAELESMKKNHELMKEGNKRIKQAKAKCEDITQYLIETFNIQPHMIDWTLKFGFGLTNNNANMKRVEERIKELEKKEKMRNEQPEKEYIYSWGKVVLNYEADRIQVFFETRPTSDELNKYKSLGLNSFNWSPSNSAWQRKITNNAIWQTKRMIQSINELKTN